MRIVSLLVSVAVLIVVAILVIKGNPNAPKRADGKGETVLGRSLHAAKDDKCLNNLGQCRLSISINTDPVDDVKPQSLDEVKVSPEMKKCSIDPFEPYNYDPATGQVSCPHPGHEKY